ncbi:MAG: G8 domain-containing protein [Planctomycetaceae bacterium]|nr:G8 domain-containing protein [Planctomycetaceae bacterium]
MWRFVFGLCLVSWVSIAMAAEKPAADEPLCIELESIAQEIALASTLLDLEQTTHTVARSGRWSDAQTWLDGKLPTDHARVRVPRDLTLTVDTAVQPSLDWLAVEGDLTFATDADTSLKVCTILVKRGGKLRIGTSAARVNADHTALVEFLPGSFAKVPDRFGVTGGLISLGTVEVYGAEKTAFGLPTTELKRGAKSITFAEPVVGWRVGDELLFPAACRDEQDERPTIKSISADQKTIALSQPLATAHRSPELVGKPIPVGNLTRNVTFRSARTESLADRGHVILMSHVGNEIHGARFAGLGRTSAHDAHTLPELKDDGTVDNGNNPIGRYAVHFHLRQAASLAAPPQHFVGNVIVDSPKHGLVNHGSYVIATDNVTFGIHGSHFFAENGSEIGAFRHNMAVYSAGSGDPIRSRDAVYDFGHGGHGFWTQSPAVTIEHNYAFHHSAAAYSIFARPVYEFDKVVFFHRKNLPADLQAMTKSEWLSNGALPYSFAHNLSGNSNVGLELWNTNTYSEFDRDGIVEHCAFWDTHEHGIFMPYTDDSVIRDTLVLHSSTGDIGGLGIDGNQKTDRVTLERVTVAGFEIGVWIPWRGTTNVTHCRLDNRTNVRIASPVEAGRVTTLADNQFGGVLKPAIKGRCDYELLPIDFAYNGDVSVLFESDVIHLQDDRYVGQTLYFAEQLASAVPFKGDGVPQLNGKTAQQLWDELQVAIAGRLAPPQAKRDPLVRGLVGPSVTKQTTLASRETKHAGSTVLDQNLQSVSFVRGEGKASQWKVEKSSAETTKFTYVDTTPPTFELDPRIKLEIHPDDLKHGIMICGLMHDDVAGVQTCKNMLMNYHDLVPDADGFVTINYEFKDAVGNLATKEYRFKVTENAQRRGPNLNYYQQKQYSDDLSSVADGGGSCRMCRSTGLIGGLAVVGLALVGGLVYRRRRPPVG